MTYNQESDVGVKKIPVKLKLFRDSKTAHLKRLLGSKEADIYPIRLWAWAALQHQDGQITAADPCSAIEDGCGWRGAEGELFAALQTCGFLAVDGKIVSIPGWTEADHVGEYLADLKARREYEYQRRHRAEKKQEEGSAEPTGVLQALAYFRSPGHYSKRRAVEDLIRMGVREDTILAKALTVEARQMDFYEFINWCRGKGNGPGSAIDRVVK